MIGIEIVVARLSGLQRPDLERWIANGWVRPEGEAGAFVFREVDVARARLIRDLRDEMDVNEAALPVVLSLLDQLYDLRRRMRDLGEALGGPGAEQVRRILAEHLRRHAAAPGDDAPLAGG